MAAAATPTTWDQFQLVSTPAQLYLVPANHASSASDPPSILALDRASGQASLLSSLPARPTAPAAQQKRRTYYGCLGLLDLRSDARGRGGLHLALIKRKIRVGDVVGRTVWRLDAVEWVRVDKAGQTLSTDAQRVLDHFCWVLTTPYFYFSHSLDLTRSRQAAFLSSQAGPDARFVWNRPLLDAASSSPFSKFLVTLIHGAVFTQSCSINGQDFTWSLISRRSRHRVGTRFFARGCGDGEHAGPAQVANFVETEQIVERRGALASFVQTRGSMPMRWEQTPDLKYKPLARLTPRTSEDAQTAAFLAHFREQIPLYGRQVVVNLIDHKKAEGALEVSLKGLCAEAGLNEVRYVGFDFHKECKSMRYDRLEILISTCQDDLRDFEYFFLSDARTSAHQASADTSALCVQRQKGLFRTNCMDCLDRTNVVQSLLAAENLKAVLRRLGVLTPQDAGDDLFRTHAGFRAVYQSSWADHADLISLQYAGTGALKTDFTRTGKRTYFGLLQDGWNSAVRYYLNNFSDGDRTDSLRLFVGECSVESYLRHRRHDQDSAKMSPAVHLPKVLAISLLVLLATLILAGDNALLDAKFWSFLLLSLAALGWFGRLTVENGPLLVNYPTTSRRLVEARAAQF